MEIFDDELRKVQYRYLKDVQLYQEIESDLTDIHSLRFIKQLIKGYFEDEYINICIDNYYEYLYNDLSSVLKFTSSISVLEILAKQNKYLDKIKKFNNKENSKSNENDKIIKNIVVKLDEEEEKFINCLYNKNSISLRYILRYYFEKIFLFKNSDEENKYVVNMIKTRNYYTHGGEKNKKLNEEEIYYTSELLESMIYLLIINALSSTVFSKNWCIIEMHKERIKNILKIFEIY